MNADEIREELAKRGISVIRRVVANDIAALNDYGYEVLLYKKKYTYYYVVNRPLDTAEVVLIADALKSSKLTPRQKNELIGKLSNLLCYLGLRHSLCYGWSCGFIDFLYKYVLG